MFSNYLVIIQTMKDKFLIPIFVLDKYEKTEVVKSFDRLNTHFAVAKIKHKIIRKDEK